MSEELTEGSETDIIRITIKARLKTEESGTDMTKKKKMIIGFSAGGLIIIAAVILFIVLWQTKPQVETAAAETGNIEAWFETTGTLQSDNTKQYVTVTQAVVEHVNVKVGD